MWVPTDPPSLTSTRLDSTRLNWTSCVHMSECGCNFLFPYSTPIFLEKKLGVFFLVGKTCAHQHLWLGLPDNSRTETVCTVPNSFLCFFFFFHQLIITGSVSQAAQSLSCSGKHVLTVWDMSGCWCIPPFVGSSLSHLNYLCR